MILILTRLYRAYQARQQRETEVTAPSASSSTQFSTPHRGATLGLLIHQVRFDLMAALRSPRSRFFTFIFPILLLVIFTSVFGHGTTVVSGVKVSLARFYLGGILTMSIVTTAYASMILSVCAARQSGLLKRRRATPVPPLVLIGGQVVATLVTATITATLLLVVARLGYGVAIPISGIVGIGCAVVIGTASFACLGYLVSGMIGSVDAAQPVIQLTTMPLYFISGVWIPTHDLGHSLQQVASIFPIEHLAAAMHAATVQGSISAALSGADLFWLGVWALAAATFAARRFSWLPPAVVN